MKREDLVNCKIRTQGRNQELLDYLIGLGFKPGVNMSNYLRAPGFHLYNFNFDVTIKMSTTETGFNASSQREVFIDDLLKPIGPTIEEVNNNFKQWYNDTRRT